MIISFHSGKNLALRPIKPKAPVSYLKMGRASAMLIATMLRRSSRSFADDAEARDEIYW